MKPFFEDPKQKDPFEDDPTKTILEDPTGGIATSREWKHPEHLEQCPVNEPQAARWQESVLAYLDTSKIVRYQCGELARWFCPPGYQGRISRLETSLIVFDAQAVFPVGLDGGLSPAAYDLSIGIPPDPVAVTFYLRLQTWQKEANFGAPMVTTTQVELPGVPHPDLGNWSDSRYDFARRDNHVSLFVPEGHVLRLFIQLVSPKTDTWPIGFWGRLGGITQMYRGNQAAIDASRRWP